MDYMKITANHLQIAGAHYFNYRQNLIVPNVSWGFLNYEADLLIIKPSRYVIEIEIKISKSDLKNDKKKKKYRWNWYLQNKIKLFYVLIPSDLYSGKEQETLDILPPNAGLLTAYYSNVYDRWYCSCVKSPIVNRNAEKLSDHEYMTLLKLAAMRIWSLKEKLLRLQNGQN